MGEERMNRNMTSMGVACILLYAVTPASAQENDPGAGGELFQKVQAEFAEAYNRKDVAAMAGFFAENGVRITPSGIFRGRDAIRREMQRLIEIGLHDYTVRRTDSRLEGDMVFNAGEWQAKLGEQQLHGYYSALLVREGDEVKILEETINVAAP
jgi:ketosteroid isomerase-like protein